ncbi:NADH-quinone oxidoreductase subunit J [Solemya velesiana gill symbiont]|uniref:NADH-quinone oxidoreductase subunit J n=1 Tax=Solemya velesiana gill symbiont TaxID=1918948 RepID=A0A1T2KW45_9GAMM|nr:NADH-quinone oxidoreductase subunit J [Solemya velesiana gill symbiont]OOZ36966.1 NADH:ubiquinone oxidoreductase subunit J [Solemya velesiana gill symbiont]
MTFEQFVFYVFAAILVFAATMVITRRNPVHSALFLVLAFFSSACIWMLAEAEFLAIVLVLVYVGAVMVLFLFVVMMLDIDVETLRAGFISYLPVGLLVAAAMALEIFLVVGPDNFGLENYAAPAARAADYNNTAEIGNVLYTVYMYPFEIAAVILLVAIIAAVGLTMRKRPETKSQDPSQQVKVKKGPDRVQVVSMEAED